ncbi:MAG: family 16 glycoside hydrolase [Isosphaeraceae bacterium]
MKRMLTGLLACLLLASPTATTRGQTPKELDQTARWTAGPQNADGGFPATPGGPSSLGSTGSSIRILKYTGGSIPNVLGAIRFVKSCVDPETGGFAQTPGGKADVATTASGLMAFLELKINDPLVVDRAVAFLSENAKTFEEVRIAVAGLEAVGKTSPSAPKWEALVREGRNGDGTWGRGVSAAKDTGGKAVALLRLGVELDQKDAILKSLRDAQRPDGVWNGDKDAPDLASSYRIMRYFHMVKASPDLERLGRFLASCRHPEGGYALEPGGEPSLSATYFATIMLLWSRQLSGLPALVETAGFQPLFNGQDLTGWEGNLELWSARDGAIVGSSPGIKRNEFLATRASFGDFVFKANFRIKEGTGNSGIQFRSVRVPGTEMSGYQADLGENYWGCLYDESRRNKVLEQASPAALRTLNKVGWNQYVIDAKGADVRLALNGVTSVSYHEDDPGIARSGQFALQIHSGGPMEVTFQDLYVQTVPSPDASASDVPGFHLRTVETSTGPRKYTLYLPTGYDGKKTFPVALFLHGSGERGEDGVKPAQVGLGPAILKSPEAFPVIAVFPQARTTWAAGSEDSKAALAALDDVLKSLKADPDRVVLTGLSMGGRGSWELAAAEPERWAAVVPICGMGQPDSAGAIHKLPIWVFVGDADRDATVLNSRAMVEAITGRGGNPRYTEYRGVGHNSWDRAYNHPALAEWILSQVRR